MQTEIIQLAKKICEGGVNLAFTGAGISTESGIPDYRSQGGIWDRFQPVYFDEFMRQRSAREEYWRQKHQMYHDLKQARPNPAHMALARLYSLGRLEAVITQNIDGLHQLSGLPPEAVIELHGNTRRVRCMGCGKLYSEEKAHQRVAQGDLAPECDCGGYLKPDTISFGQSMPEQAVAQAQQLCLRCDLLLAIGSTLQVYPAAALPGLAKENSAFLALINLSKTPYDAVCDLRIQGKAGLVMQAVLEEVEKQLNAR